MILQSSRTIDTFVSSAWGAGWCLFRVLDRHQVFGIIGSFSLWLLFMADSCGDNELDQIYFDCIRCLWIGGR